MLNLTFMKSASLFILLLQATSIFETFSSKDLWFEIIMSSFEIIFEFWRRIFSIDSMDTI
jgi:hypothetical protein